MTISAPPASSPERLREILSLAEAIDVGITALSETGMDQITLLLTSRGESWTCCITRGTVLFDKLGGVSLIDERQKRN